MVPAVLNRPCLFLLTIVLVLDVAATGISRVVADEKTPEAKAAIPAARQRTPEQASLEGDVLHDLMHDTLQIVHHRYYKEDEGLELPAGTLLEVFADIAQEHQVKLRWLVVEGQAMNSDHIAQDDFERAAVQALLTGKKKYDAIEGGVYRRAGPIVLSNVCLKCHVPDRRSTENRIAGLLISIPVKK